MPLLRLLLLLLLLLLPTAVFYFRRHDFFTPTPTTATPTSDPSSGEPFNCEMWDRQRYSDYRDEDTENLITDWKMGNNSGEIDDEERYGCPINITMLSRKIHFV